ncbi:beta-lactamase/transpeptidase-like protein [Obelidium mucronatum]|nr:beta-lactamase/transpeptidase-like protein [Obelidium mucronatum]
MVRWEQAETLNSCCSGVNWDALSAELDAVRNDWKAPGLAVGVVSNGKLVYSKGFGVRNEHGDPVTAETLFQIGSTTKFRHSRRSRLVRLVDENRISWDTKVTNVSTVQFQDPVANKYANFIDIMSHRTGLPRHDLLFFISKSVEDINSKIKYLQPSKEFREVYQYNNHMFDLAGSIAGKVYGATWGKLVQDRILKPLGMINTETDISLMETHKDHSRGFRYLNEKLVPFEYEKRGGLVENEEPDGSMVSNIEDLAKWVTLINNRGVDVKGTRLISEDQFNQIMSLHTPMNIRRKGSGNNPVQLSAYGLAWIIESYRGISRIEHGGAVMGFRAQISTYPTQKFAVIALSNLDGSPVVDIASNIMTDRILFPNVAYDWSSEYRSLMDERKRHQAEDRSRAIRTRKNGTLPTLSYDKYTGAFQHQAYGLIQLNKFSNNGTSSFSWSADFETPARINGIVGHWEEDVFGVFEAEIIDYKDYEVPKFRFEFQSGRADEFLVQVEEGVAPVLFERVV